MLSINYILQGAKQDNSKSKIDTTTVVMDVEFQCSGDDFYNVLTTPDVSNSIYVEYNEVLLKMFNF